MPTLFTTAIATLVASIGAFLLKSWPRQTKGGPPMAKYGWPIIGHLLIFIGLPKDIPRLAFRGIEGNVVEATIFGSTFYLLRGADAIKTFLGSSSLKTRKSKSDVETSKILGMHEIGIVLNDHVPSWKHSRKLFAEGIGRPGFLKSLAPKLNAKMISVCAKLLDLAQGKNPILGNQLVTAISADIIADLVLSDSRGTAEKIIENSSNPSGQSWKDDFVQITLPARIGHINKMQDFVEEQIRGIQKMLESEPANNPLQARDLATTIYLSLASSGDSEHTFKHAVACAKEALIGGHDTTRNSMAFLLYELARHPAVCDAIHDEIIQALGQENEFTDDSIKKMKLLNAAILEANRIYSIAPMVTRGLEEDMVVEGHTLKAGAELMFTFISNHHDENVWQDPLIFNPHRFLHMEPSPGPMGFGYGFTPFGHGLRKCPGQNLAMLEISVVIGHLIKSFKFHLVDQNMELKVNEFNMVRECTDFGVQFTAR
ncbi:cytochrome P450 [Obelidium mucronatum]|nr:cytochrome P450 [Obelidium mucronatum]